MPKIHPTAIIDPGATIGEGSEIGPYAIIEGDVTIGKNNRVLPHAFIGHHTVLGDGNEVHPGAVIGHDPQDRKYDAAIETWTRIGDNNIFREHCSIHRATKPGEATVIGSGGYFMANTHIAHDCVVGDNVTLVNNASLTGHCELGDNAILSGLTGIHQFCRVGRLAMVSALSGTNKDLPPFMIFGGRPAVSQGLNLVGLRRAGIGPVARKQLKEAYRILYRAGLPIPEAVERLEAMEGEEVAELVTFIKASKRGICFGASDAEDTLRAARKTGRARHAIAESGDESDGSAE